MRSPACALPPGAPEPLEDGPGTCRSQESQRGHRLRPLPLAAVEGLRRLRLHVPPRGGQRIRHGGCLANRVRQAQRVQCRALLGQTRHSLSREAAVALERQPSTVAAGELGAVWPACQHGRMPRVHTVSRQPAAWALAGPVPGRDTSERQPRQTPARVLDSRPGPPGAAWCVHTHPPGLVPEELGEALRPPQDP
jgi:Putative transposase